MHRPPPLATSTTALLTALLPAQHDATAPQAPPGLVIGTRSDAAQQAIAAFQLAPGLVCDLLASEPDLCNPVAFAIDDQGRVYVAETFRINDGVFDTRNYMQWKDEDLALRTVAERVAKYGRHLAKELPKYGAFPERVRLLVDSDKNGTLDRSTVFADGFTDLADGIASGVLPVGGDVYFTNIPKLWRLRDRDGDGVADERTVLHDGYGVHTSLIGHDLHGLIVGPDRRLYFSIGDRGFRIEQGDRVHDYPHEGAVLRCELDGSDLEVVHRGLRNPQELAFDDHGDLFTGDNNSDGGDRARFVQIVPGADSGWRIGYQWLDDRGAWNREKLWQPRHPGQPAWILPPIANVADGPSGLAYDPGQGLPAEWRGCFFLCDFRGGSSYSGVHALRLERAGAGYELVSTQKPIWGVLCTDVDFAPDGSLYVLDWVKGWNKSGLGRIYRVRTAAMANDLALRATAQLLAADLSARPAAQLRALLGHADRRVRQRAQFALVDQGAVDVLDGLAAAPGPVLPRVHAVFGLGILARRDAALAARLLPRLDDGDGEVRAAAARMLGDVRHAAARPGLQRLLGDRSSRVRREAALALARLPAAELAPATAALLTLLRDNDDRDAVLRHAAVLALAQAGGPELAAALQDPSRAVRLGAVLALARRQDPALAAALRDSDAAVRFEAARAIHGEPVEAALADLARLAADDTADLPAIDWRALNACRVLGTVEAGETLVHAAALAAHPPATRREALAILAEWPAPHGQDRVTGNWRPCQHPAADRVVAAFAAAAPGLLGDAAVAAAAAKACGQLRLAGAAGALRQLVADTARSAGDRLAALDALAAMDAPELLAAVEAIEPAAPAKLRQRAVALLSRQHPAKAVPLLATLLQNGSLGEQQAACEALGGLRDPAAAALLGDWLDRLAAGAVPAGLQLDLAEAAQRHDDAALRAKLAAWAQQQGGQGPLGEFLACREGGDRDAGRRVFHDLEATRCTRCHALGKDGGNAGPRLDGIGKLRDRDYLLEALVQPSARIAEGFGAVRVDLHDGTLLQGVVTKDQDGMLTVVDVAGKAVEVPWGKVQKRTPLADSAMPAMGGALSKRQLRDLIEFLASQR